MHVSPVSPYYTLARIALLALALVLTVSASRPVRALTPDALQAQLPQLPAHIPELAAQFNALRSPGILSAPTAALPASFKRICAMMLGSFAIGEESGKRCVCQELLHSESYCRVEPAGHFGPLTCDAFARWYVAYGFGPAGLIRAKTIVRCAGARGDRTNQGPPKPEDDPRCKEWTNGIWCGGGCSRKTPGGKPQCVMPECVMPRDGVIPPPQPARCLEYF